MNPYYFIIGSNVNNHICTKSVGNWICEIGFVRGLWNLKDLGKNQINGVAILSDSHSAILLSSLKTT